VLAGRCHGHRYRQNLDFEIIARRNDRSRGGVDLNLLSCATTLCAVWVLRRIVARRNDLDFEEKDVPTAAEGSVRMGGVLGGRIGVRVSYSP
jgi:hypothetical protein